jgi:hypothetical protein
LPIVPPVLQACAKTIGLISAECPLEAAAAVKSTPTATIAGDIF